MYGINGSSLWTDHLVYIASGSSDVLIDGSKLDGISGAAVQIGGGNGTASSNVTVRNSRLTNSGWGASVSLAKGAVFQDDVIDGNQVAFRVSADSSTISNNTIRGPVGIAVSPLPPALALGEGRNCFDSPVPFRDYGKPANLTLSQWQAATGQGVGDTIGTCP